MASSSKSKSKGGSKTASKLGKSSQPVSWRRKYKSILREKVDDWANTSSLEEERAVIDATMEAIEAQLKEAEDPEPLPDQITEVSF
jgi:hypothetical protein